MSIALIDNYYALLVSIVTKKTPEQAFVALGRSMFGRPHKKKPTRPRHDITEQDVKNMVRNDLQRNK